MCRTCVRNGTTLIFSTRDPDEKPIEIEVLAMGPNFTDFVRWYIEAQQLIEKYKERNYL